MITDAELIERIRAADPVAEITNDLSRSSTERQLLLAIEDRLASVPPVPSADVSPTSRGRWLALAAAVVLIAGTLATAWRLTRSDDETVAVRGAEVGGDPLTADAPVGLHEVVERIERLATTGLGEGHVRAAVAAGPGVVAVGDDAAVWSTEDGFNWTSVRIDTSGIDTARFDITLNDVVAGGPGLVAAGAIDSDEFYGVPEPQMEARDRCLQGDLAVCDPDWPEIETGAAVWVSEDGATWTRTFTDISVGGAAIHAVAEGGPGFIAVGSSGRGGEVWTSEDGIDWLPSEDDGAAFAGHRLLDVFSTDSQLVAVGSAVWASTDGFEWRFVSDVEDPWYDSDDDRMGIRDVASGPNGYVGVGFSGIWTSVDALVWTRVPDINDVIGSSHLDVVYGDDSGYVALGQSSLGGPGAAFSSPNGFTWTEIPYETSVWPDDVVVVDGDVLVVGSGLNEADQMRPVVWKLVTEVEE